MISTIQGPCSLQIFGNIADADADAVTPSSNTRSYTRRSVPSSPGRSFSDLPSLGPKSQEATNAEAPPTRWTPPLPGQQLGEVLLMVNGEENLQCRPLPSCKATRAAPTASQLVSRT